MGILGTQMSKTRSIFFWIMPPLMAMVFKGICILPKDFNSAKVTTQVRSRPTLRGIKYETQTLLLKEILPDFWSL